MDVIALVRHAIDPTTPLAPVGMTVEERYQQWLAEQAGGGGHVHAGTAAMAGRHQGPHRQQPEHRAGRLGEVPFNQIGGLGRAYELFGDQLPASSMN